MCLTALGGLDAETGVVMLLGLAQASIQECRLMEGNYDEAATVIGEWHRKQLDLAPCFNGVDTETHSQYVPAA